MSSINYGSEAAVENVLEWLRGSKEISGTLCRGRLQNKILKLAESHPDEVKIETTNEDGSIFFHMPLKYLRIQVPTQREMSEEEKDELRERLESYRKNK